MRHQIGGDERDAFRIAHQRLQRGPLGFKLFFLRQLLAFGDFLKLCVQLRQLGGVKGQSRRSPAGSPGASYGLFPTPKPTPRTTSDSRFRRRRGCF